MMEDTKSDEYEQRIKNFSAKYAHELTELRAIIGNKDLQVFVDDEYESQPVFCVLNGNGDWIDTYYGYDLALANIKTLLENGI